jgi:Cu/Ag efflux protein CusF
LQERKERSFKKVLRGPTPLIRHHVFVFVRIQSEALKADIGNRGAQCIGGRAREATEFGAALLSALRLRQSVRRPASCVRSAHRTLRVPPKEPIRHHGLSRTQETAIKIAKTILAGTLVLIIISSAAFAQQELTGTVTQVDRINRTVAIKQTQSGTSGASNGGAAEEYKAQDSLSLDKLHAGDKVTFSATETGGIKTITKLQNQ